MKAKIDTNEKTIILEESIRVEELFDVLKKLFPHGLWKQFTLELNPSFMWNYPTWNTVDYSQPHTGSPVIQQPWITCTSASSDSYEVDQDLVPGVYYLDINLSQ